MGVSTAGNLTRAPSATRIRRFARGSSEKVWRPDMGYRMAWALGQDGFAPLNLKQVHRVWREMRSLARASPQSAPGTRSAARRLQASGAWISSTIRALNGTKLKILSVVDEFTRGSAGPGVGHPVERRPGSDVLAPADRRPRRSGLRPQRQRFPVRRPAPRGVPVGVGLREPVSSLRAVLAERVRRSRSTRRFTGTTWTSRRSRIWPTPR